MRSFLALSLLTVALPSFAADAAPAKNWTDAGELSFVNANGNTKTQTTSVKDAYSYSFSPKTKLDLEGGGLGAKSQGVVTAEQYDAFEKVERKVDDRNYLFEKYRWDRNRFAGVAHRHDFSAGAGRELWKTSKDLWVAEGAPGYVNEERIADKRKTFASARAYTKYARDLSATAKFSQDAEWIQSLADKRDSRLNTETDLIASISTHFSVKNSFVWHRDNRPPQNKGKDDTILSVALIANF